MNASAPLSLVAALLVAACGSDSALDAGHDAGRRDGGVDSGPDAGRDGGRDAGRRDAGRDGGWDAGPPSDWIPLPGLPESCPIALATDPARAFGELYVEDCPDRPGCRQLRPSREGFDEESFFRFARSTGAHDGERGLVVLHRLLPEGYDMAVLGTDGEVLVLMRGSPDRAAPDWCRFSAVDVADTGEIAFVVVQPLGPSSLASWVFGGRVADLASTLVSFGRPAQGEIPASSTFHWVRVGPGRIGLESAAYHTVYDLTWDGTATRVADSRDGGEVNVRAAVGDLLLYDVVSAGAPHTRVARAGEWGEPLLPDAAGSVATDGTDLAWLQGYGDAGVYAYDRVELWTSPVASRVADLAPRRVRELPIHPLYSLDGMGGGHAVVVEDVGVSGVYRLSDGARAELRAPEGLQWLGRFQYLTSEEVAIAAGGRNARGRLQDTALMMIRLDSLAFEVP